jgi:peptidyl-prolyl cis-trans isomerase A (cyclophilin A)
MMFSMQSPAITRKVLAAITVLTGFALASSAQATRVQFQTVMGDFEVNLYDHDPAVKATVDNFLKYVKATPEDEVYGNYANTIIHRSVPGFVIQGGGYIYDDELPPTAITSGPKITNQPVYSNVKGTITMAKLASSVNSATNQWFINLEDNSGGNAQLDRQNGGFTVFGVVEGNGMNIVNAIAALNRFNMGTPFNTIPLIDYTAQNALDNVPVDADNFVTVTDIVILDENPNTAAGLNPPKNTLINKKDDDSGGSMNILFLGLLSLLALGRKYRFNRG